ncbi:MAG: beta-phosphoglucomutase [Clostridia bacterium]|nr:beta-phosphoglucomutase [Clostridia bacterium]
MHKYFEAALFDLDGVLVDTAKYHFLAWKQIGDGLGFEFTVQDNERLKGVSRMDSLNILLSIGKLDFTEAEKERLADKKNKLYVGYIAQIGEEELLPGTLKLLKALRLGGVKIAIGSASKNTPLIIERLGIRNYFDAISDGNSISKAKPNPEVFIRAAEMLKVSPENCVVFEDAEAGVKAAKNAGMYAIGVGREQDLPEADTWVKDLEEVDYKKLFQII